MNHRTTKIKPLNVSKRHPYTERSPKRPETQGNASVQLRAVLEIRGRKFELCEECTRKMNQVLDEVKA